MWKKQEFKNPETPLAKKSFLKVNLSRPGSFISNDKFRKQA